MNPIRILLADDHCLFRAGIRSLLERVVDTEVVGEVGNGREALQFIQIHPPDAVLMDIVMPELNGLDATARIAAQFPQVRVMMLSMNTSKEYVLQALRAGACGYLVKTVSAVEMELAVNAVRRGETYLCSAVSKHVMQAYIDHPGSQPDSWEGMTARQREVLQLVAEGNSTKEIAHKLELSTKTIEMHRAQLMTALDIHDVPGLVRYAIRTGLITADA